MKCAVLLLLCAAAMAQREPTTTTTQSPILTVTVEELVWLEVGNILRADSRITLSECKSRCDAHFALSDALDESITDMLCQQECELALSGHEDSVRPPWERPGRK